MYRWHVGAVGLLLLASLGCPFGPADATPPTPAEAAAAGHYTLMTANGATLPAPAGSYVITNSTGSTTCHWFADVGTLQLDTLPQQYTFQVNIRTVCPTGISTPPSSVTDTQKETGSWSLTGSQLTLSHTGGSNLGASNSAQSGATVTVDIMPSTADNRTLPKLSLVLQR